MPIRTQRAGFDRTLRWVSPVGNLGDALVLSAALRAGHEATKERFGVHRLQPASSLFVGHPAVAQIACVDVDEQPVPLQRTDWWNLTFAAQPKGLRPYAKLCLMLFGRVLGEEAAWAPVHPSDADGLAALPVQQAPILIAPAVDSPRKEWPHERWVALVAGLRAATAIPIVQVGLPPLRPVAGALNLSGKLAPRELLALVGRSQACITVDPFLIHAAFMQRVPALNLLGPVSEGQHAYPSQVNLADCRPCDAPCLDGDRAAYASACPMRQTCMSRLSVEAVMQAFASRILPGLHPGARLCP